MLLLNTKQWIKYNCIINLKEKKENNQILSLNYNAGILSP